jgi:hypothetical protein
MVTCVILDFAFIFVAHEDIELKFCFSGQYVGLLTQIFHRIATRITLIAWFRFPQTRQVVKTQTQIHVLSGHA